MLSRELLGESSDKEFEHAEILVDLNSRDGEPLEELLCLDSRNFEDGAVTKLANDVNVVENELVNDVDVVVGGAELEVEEAIGGEGVGYDIVGEETF